MIPWRPKNCSLEASERPLASLERLGGGKSDVSAIWELNCEPGSLRDHFRGLFGSHLGMLFLGGGPEPGSRISQKPSKANGKQLFLRFRGSNIKSKRIWKRHHPEIGLQERLGRLLRSIFGVPKIGPERGPKTSWMFECF